MVDLKALEERTIWIDCDVIGPMEEQDRFHHSACIALADALRSSMEMWE